MAATKTTTKTTTTTQNISTTPKTIKISRGNIQNKGFREEIQTKSQHTNLLNKNNTFQKTEVGIEKQQQMLNSKKEMTIEANQPKKEIERLRDNVKETNK